MNIVVDSRITIPRYYADLHQEAISWCTLPNPEYLSRKAKGMYVPSSMPRSITMYHILDNGDLVIPRGLALKVWEWFASKGNTPPWDDRRLKFQPYPYKSSVELRSYQVSPVEKAIQVTQGTIISPPRSGKTTMGLKIAALTGQPLLVLVHTDALMKQWAKRAEVQLCLDSVGMIGGGQWKEEVVTIASVQTLMSRMPLPKEFLNKWGMVISDEAHHDACNTIKTVLEEFPAYYRFGITATPERADRLHPMIFKLCGDVIHEVTNQELEDAGVQIKPHVIVVKTNFDYTIPSQEDDVEPDMNRWYTKILSALWRDEDRNKLIVDYLESQYGHRNLVISGREKHCRMLEDALHVRIPHVRTKTIVGGTDSTERDNAFDLMRSGNMDYIFSCKIAEEGLDLNALDRLFFCFPGKFVGRLKQIFGRITGSCDGKVDAVIYDFADYKIGVIWNQVLHRNREIYKPRGWKTTVVEYPKNS